MEDLASQLLDKAEVTDVSKAVTEAVSGTAGLKEQIEELRKSLHGKMSR